MGTTQMVLHVPNPTDWLTRRAAARRIGVSPRTVERLVEARVLTDYRPDADNGESAPMLLWRAEVDEVRDARRRLELGSR